MIPLSMPLSGRGCGGVVSASAWRSLPYGLRGRRGLRLALGIAEVPAPPGEVLVDVRPP
ncbi:hypothetical protein [Streptomyces sp. NBC_00236]|uniref:hypothetical protein n=1 Tax=Streptomyces sp. NBC_00236 TaxID=2903639 RepID=UPI002E27B537|nr:hypothetical protein [Streptomyces sp. NBC_00236]